MRVPVSLRGAGGNHFLPEHEIELRDGRIEPIEYKGVRYLFSSRAPAKGYRGTGDEDLHIFVQDDPAETRSTR